MLSVLFNISKTKLTVQLKTITLLTASSRYLLTYSYMIMFAAIK